MKYPREKSVIIIGVWLIILPYLGVPRSWKSFITVFCGIILIYIGVLILKVARNSNIEVSEIKKVEKEVPEKITINS